MLDESLVFHKTALGAGEIAGPSRTLGAKLRRALIMVDGVKSVAELAPMFREGEIDAVLEELQAGGYISLEGGELAPPASGAGEAAARRPEFDDAKRAFIREVMDRLGPNGDTLALRIERAASPAEMRGVLAEAEQVMTAFLGAAAARAFVEKAKGRFAG